MTAFALARLLEQRRQSGRAYLEFLCVPTMSMGIYELPAGGVDPQKPHQQDEVYYVLQGKGMIRVGTEEQAVAPGSLIFVPAHVQHRFHSIAENLSLLVFFAPAESE
jgi:mannose-6-phosphate isomerase-like protein (cupin superfamily)